MQFRIFFRNLVSGFAWAWMDITCKYRRSVIGPFWETINVAVTILGVSYISSVVFGTNAGSNVPFIGLGIIAWAAISSIVTEGATCFINHREYIKNSSLRIDLYVARTVFRVFITIAHYLLLYVVGVLLLPIPVSAASLMSLIGFLFLLVNALWLMPTLGFLCARFRDLEMIVRNLLQLAFFITPVFWNYTTINPHKMFIVLYNPLFYFLEAIRAPLLGEPLPAWHYAVLLAITACGYGLLWLSYRRMRRNLAFYT